MRPRKVGWRAHTLFKEEAHLVPRVQEVRVADVVRTIVATSGKLCHWMVLKLKIVQHLVCVLKQLLHCIL